MISDYSQRITIKSVTPAEDFGFGGTGVTETNIFSTWASIKEISRKDAIRQGLDAETLQYRLRIRYTAGRIVDKDNVITWNLEDYKPRTSPQVIEIDKKKFLELIIVRQDG